MNQYSLIEQSHIRAYYKPRFFELDLATQRKSDPFDSDMWIDSTQFQC